jgi:hypothetical protein
LLEALAHFGPGEQVLVEFRRYKLKTLKSAFAGIPEADSGLHGRELIKLREWPAREWPE